MMSVREAADRVRRSAYLHNSYTKLRPALRELAAALDAPPPAGSLREAALAVLAAVHAVHGRSIFDQPLEVQQLVMATEQLGAALDAPPPGMEELRAKLEAMWDTAIGYGITHDGPMDEDDPERDRLIAELLAMFEARQPHTDRSKPCPTCGFYISWSFVIVEDDLK